MMQIESLNGVITFVTAARSSSFTEAAEHLGVSKSAVGKAISRLEERLGTQLFHRTTRRIRLSADGEAYFAACATALDEIKGAEDSLGPRANEPAGRLRVDMPVAFGRQVIMPMLLSLAKQFPRLKLSLSFSDHLIDPIEEGVDLMIRFGEIGDQSNLVARKLASQRWVICGSPEYLARQGYPDGLHSLERHDCIVGFRRGLPLSWRLCSEGQNIRFAPPSSHQFSDGAAMIDATLAGLGLCQMPLYLFRQHITDRRLVEVLAELEPDPVDIYALWPKTSHLRPKVRYVVDQLIELSKHW